MDEQGKKTTHPLNFFNAGGIYSIIYIVFLMKYSKRNEEIWRNKNMQWYPFINITDAVTLLKIIDP